MAKGYVVNGVKMRLTTLCNWGGALCTSGPSPEHPAPASRLDMIPKYRRVALDWLMNSNPYLVSQ